ncbi:hypothetical protein [Ignicoccus hospitalis]|uniref:Polymerase nucleotidyl transferase domain-containing protein n=1 Tax=Ignicoccus hospitalis (strain KIN4/I / DSM 18386 / JCM 14125) TaxID=453591 RepID=A8A8I1_IGNH4|nr:hypothetical protein [Ignicoccus hospitalis]ABU81233.1 hypothetical protein Igni_0049 [Ignicoccus hospitalis KIN4/I]HIH90663.1 hypothetical protein [Desulfurococcaceae archaeon]
MSPLEGFLAVYRGFVWVVKGVDVCEEGVIAYPRYDLKGRKLEKDVVDNLVRSALELTDCAPRPVPLLPLGETELVDPRHLLEADPAAKDFASLFPCEVGLTGSRALGMGGGDVDLVVYDESCFNDVIETLRELKAKGEIGPYEGKWDALGPRARRKRKEYSVLEGVWKGIPYSIRLVKGPRSPRRPVAVAQVIRRGVVVRSDPYTPTQIVLHDGTVVESLRLQHAELPRGYEVVIEGILEVRADGVRVSLPPGGRLEILAP